MPRKRRKWKRDEVGIRRSAQFVLRSLSAASRGNFPVATGSALLALYFVCVGYLTWFRFAPPTIRHICGCALFGIWLWFLPFVGMMIQNGFARVAAALALGAAMHRIYRWACRYFVGLLFGP